MKDKDARELIGKMWQIILRMRVAENELREKLGMPTISEFSTDPMKSLTRKQAKTLEGILKSPDV